MSDYIYDASWSEERKRLAGLESVLDPGTFDILSSIGVTEGWTCLEIGGGGGSVTRWLCDQVGSTGRVVATDLDPRFLLEIDAPNLEVRTHDIVRESIEADTFDLVHSRDVLEHLPDREAVLDKMVDAVKPGGWLVAEDVDFASALRGSEGFGEATDLTPVESKMWSSVVKGMKPRGIDPEYGRRLPWRLRARGLDEVQATLRGTLVQAGHPSQDLLVLSVTHNRQLMMESGISDEEFETLLASLKDPEFMGFGPFHVAAWGRKPV
jgi:SAM-dependent methyltransferase